MTDAERKLWQYFRAGRLDGVKFRRQHPVPPYVADFCCVSARLIIELDGSQHCEEVDAARTRYLESQGWRVLRFWDNDVLLETEAVVDAIWNVVGDRTLSPTPLPVGEGLRSEAVVDAIWNAVGDRTLTQPLSRWEMGSRANEHA